MSTVTGSPVGISAGDKLVEPWFDGYEWQESMVGVSDVRHLKGVSVIFLANPWRGAMVKLHSETLTYVEAN